MEKCADGKILGQIPTCTACGGGRPRFDRLTVSIFLFREYIAVLDIWKTLILFGVVKNSNSMKLKELHGNNEYAIKHINQIYFIKNIFINMKLQSNHFFFFVAFRIWKEHISDSSTLIIAPEFSNYPQ